MLLHAENIARTIRGKRLFAIEKIQIQTGDRNGLIGDNGSGKTTLLNILAGTEPPDGGQVTRRCAVAHIRQFAAAEPVRAGRLAGVFGMNPQRDGAPYSGGEIMKARIISAVARHAPLVLADEPASNLDLSSIDVLRETLDQLQTFVLVSHDRALLDALCTTIWELRDAALTVYPGNYSDYAACRERMEKTAQREYEQYVGEKNRLKSIAREKKRAAAKIVRKPKDRGPISSERFTSRSKGGQQKALQRQARSVEKHIEMLGVKEKPYTPPAPLMDFSRTDPPQGKVILRAKELSFACSPARPVFQNAAFAIENRQRTALAGGNGCGKTTLLNLLYEGNDAVACAPKVRFGYFRQGFSQPDGGKTVYENILRVSVQPTVFTRTVFARMLFYEDDLHKPAAVLSGGETVRLALAQLILSDANVLLLDEPTNYLDIRSLRALEDGLVRYQGAVIFASHDRRFVDTVATRTLRIARGQVQTVS